MRPGAAATEQVGQTDAQAEQAQAEPVQDEQEQVEQVPADKTAEPQPAAAPDEAAQANAEQVAELTAALQRERAQFANFKRRSAEEKQGSVAYGKRVLAEAAADPRRPRPGTCPRRPRRRPQGRRRQAGRGAHRRGTGAVRRAR